MGRVTINGKTFSVADGANVSIVNNQIFVDGRKLVHDVVQIAEVTFVGNLNELKTDGSAHVDGTINGNVQSGGSVSCDAVRGNVTAGGSVNCDDVGGDVSAGGSVNADRIKGERR